MTDIDIAPTTPSTTAASAAVPTSIYGEYVQLTKQYQAKYGPRTIVLLQVGAFFEVYGFRPADTWCQIADFAQKCNLNISEKKATYEGRQVVMAGFRDYTLDKYLQRLTENEYTAVVYIQEKRGKTIIRVLDSVHSAGTYISYEVDALPQMTNNIACIWLDIYQPKRKSTTNLGNQHSVTVAPSSATRPTIVCGIAVANIYTGKSTLTEFQHSFMIQPSTFDELERAIAIHAPSEVIVVSSLDDSQISAILQYGGIHTRVVHRICSKTSEKAKHCTEQKYIRHILSTFYGEDTADQCIEFSTYPTATQAFCFLLDFVQEHNPNLVRNIRIPDFCATTQVILANHTLKQLNILGSGDGAGASAGAGAGGRISSVSAFLNRCCSSMGKRRFHAQLVAPTTDEAWLATEYDMIEKMLEPNTFVLVDTFRKILGQVRDIEKLCRQLVLRKIYPSSVFHLYGSVQVAQQIHTLLAENPEIQDYLSVERLDIEKECANVLEFLDSHLWIDRCQHVSSLQHFPESIVKPGICAELDRAIGAFDKNTRIFHAIHQYLNKRMSAHEKGPLSGSDPTEYVKIHETEKSGVSLQITKKRGAVLKKILSQEDHSSNPDAAASAAADLGLGLGVIVHWNTVKFISASTSNDELEFPLLTNVCREMQTQKDELNRWIAKAFDQVLGNFETRFYEILEAIATYLAKIDVLQTKAFLSREYHYCKPILDSSAQKSFVEASDLRHVLIEHIQTNEIYVANDLSLGQGHVQGHVQGHEEKNGGGQGQDGILLYGTNAVGKTSLIRALGISVIMAQSGLYVPCSAFRYKPYSAIFSRILGNDNLFKGLSTFAVEMSELRVILKMADQGSLILGDELCSGTETESALSIFVAGLMDLHAKQASFIFATHFHEIVRYEEIQALDRLSLKHLAVHYDRELDALVYDRRLQDGAGNRMYGLEVCKSLHLSEDFLDCAYKIRAKYFPDTKGELSHGKSTYNASKIRGMCEMCFVELGEEIHHIIPQQMADENGFITEGQGQGQGNKNKNKSVFHKNHPANLMTVCESCHVNAHKKQKNDTDSTSLPIHIQTRKKTTRGYKIM